MQIPLQITFRGLDHSDAVEGKIREKVAKLEQLHDRIVGCRVVIEVPHKQAGNDYRVDEPFRIGIELTIPGSTIVVKRDARDPKSNADILVALKEAFVNAERQLKDTLERQRDDAKAIAGQDGVRA